MGDSSYRLNFDQGKKNEIQHHKLERAPQNEQNFRLKKWLFFPRVISIYTKFANFTGLYFPHLKTIRNQTLQFY